MILQQQRPVAAFRTVTRLVGGYLAGAARYL
jgi:hypothetical protein